MSIATYNSQILPVDLVITPLATYMIVSFKDPYVAVHPEEAGGIDDYSGDRLFSISADTDLEAGIEVFMEEHPMLEVKAETDIYHEHIDMPEGTLGYVLSRGCIRRAAEHAREMQIGLDEALRKEGIQPCGIPSLEDYLDSVRHCFIQTAWNQLVRRAARNYLDFDNDTPPYRLIFDDCYRGFAIIDLGTEGNCGFGAGKIFLYEILKAGDAVPDEDGLFYRQAMEARQVSSSTVSFLPPSAHNAEKVADLERRGRVIEIDGWLAFIDMPGKEARREPDRLP